MGAPAARVGDMHTCPMVEGGTVPHVGGPLGCYCPHWWATGYTPGRFDGVLGCSIIFVG